MEEIIFTVKESDEGGYEARSIEYSIFTDGDSMEELKENIKEAIHCHFYDDVKRIIRLHFVREEVFAA